MKWLIVFCLCLTGCGVGRYNTSNVVIVNESTGFLIDSFVCTAAHVVDGEQFAVIRYQNGKEDCATVVAIDQKSDIALLKVDKPVFVPYDIADPHIRETVVAIANPAHLWFSELEGKIQGIERIDEFGTPLIQVSIDGFWGASGGPILNQNGELIGVISKFIPGTRFTFVVPIQKVVLLIKKQRR